MVALGQCVLAGSFASYYWAFDKKTVSICIYMHVIVHKFNVENLFIINGALGTITLYVSGHVCWWIFANIIYTVKDIQTSIHGAE